MNNELNLLPICWEDAEKRRMATILDKEHREEEKRRERWNRLFDCFMMGAAGAMTACVVLTILGLA